MGRFPLSLIRTGYRLGCGLAALALSVTAASATAPGPGDRPPPTGRYPLFVGNATRMMANAVSYGALSNGEIGPDGVSDGQVGVWPKGTANQYMLNSGFQVVGIIQGSSPSNPWAGDTTGGMFYDSSGLRQHGSPVTEVSNSAVAADAASWPQAAFVPEGDISAELFAPELRGRLSASQGDVWFVSRETNPALSSGRPHPLGIVAEHRLLAWNFPAGNQDVLYLITTFYNVSTTDQAAYAQYRPGMRELLLAEAQRFHADNNTAFGITLPPAGYTIDPFYVNFAADPDVTTSAGINFASVNLPFAMGYAYHADFPRASNWTFSPTVFGPPFFTGTGLVGMKYLKSPGGAPAITLYSNFTGGGAFPIPNSAARLFKNASGTVTPLDGTSCNLGDPLVSNICFIHFTPADILLMQSTGGLALPPGGATSVALAYVHAAPVQVPGYVGGTRVSPGNPTRLRNAALLAQGANLIDSISGFNGYADANGDGIVQAGEMSVVPGSLLAKALVAQAVFDQKFVLPRAPDAPDFFLIPGNEKVTVLWRPSAAETDGDPFFAIASQPTIVPDGGGAAVNNVLFDPNYRNFDVEGYRIYRGRADTPTALKVIAQFDYSGTTFRDFLGGVVSDDIGSRCLPEIGVTTSCPGFFSPIIPGTTPTLFRSYDLVGNFVQVRAGDRTLLASGNAINLVTDTAVTGGGTGFNSLDNTGVPFLFIDNAVRNGLSYYYAVTAFDINSIRSTGTGNSSLESSRITKRAIPNTTSGNYVNEEVTESGIFGRSGLRTDNVAPTIDPVTGRFDKMHLPSNGASVSLAGFVRELLTGSGAVALSVDSIVPVGFAGATSVTADYYLSIDTPIGVTKLTDRRVLSSTISSRSSSGSFPALQADAALAQRYNAPVGGSFGIAGSFTTSWPGLYYQTISSRGCVNFAAGFPNEGTAATAGQACAYNGPRWFSGANETMDHPNSSNMNRFRTGRDRFDFNNAGQLPGVATIFIPRAYDDYAASWRDTEGILGSFASTGDFRVYWGTGGTVDSVIDLTHDVVVPFSPNLGPTWGILNSAATQATGYQDQRLEISGSDIGCVEPIRTLNPSGINCTAPAAQLSETAVPFPVVYSTSPAGEAAGSFVTDRTAPARQPGFIFYLKGHSFVMELEGGALPAAGTQWTMRTYTGAIGGGQGRNTDVTTPYVFTTQNQPRPFNVLGATAAFQFDVTNEVQSSTKETLNQIHTVPDPYYVTSAFESTTANKIIKFVNLPEKATIRIYTVSGVLVRVLKHETGSFSGESTWDVRNRNNRVVASGVYFYHVTAENGKTTVGRMTIVNFRQKSSGS